MSRLFEYQAKELLKKAKIAVPRGGVATAPAEAERIARDLGKPVVVKGQMWVTGRAKLGAIKFSDTPEQAAVAAGKIIGLKVKEFTVDRVIVEEKLDVEREFYAGVVIDDSLRQPVVVFGSVGGTGIEEIAKEHPDKVGRVAVSVTKGLGGYEARNVVRRAGVGGSLLPKLGTVVSRLYEVARNYEARAAEINPLVLTSAGDLVAADCRITIDDYAVFRHPELGIEIARELDRPATALEKIAYGVEAGDYRGTFFFIQMEAGFKKGEGYIGFHGAGGGGSMMSMDAVLRRGYKLANFCDTSGNPPASKVYRASRIILAQRDIDAYFGSGSGVASQEQFHSARGLVKAFREEGLAIPAVVRLGGNSEELAIEILTGFTKDLPAPVECYGKDDAADFCAERLSTLLEKCRGRAVERRPWRKPQFKDPYTFETLTGTVSFDHARCTECESNLCVEVCIPKILKLEDGKPILAKPADEIKRGGCIECLACELECGHRALGACYVDLPIPGLDEYLQR